MKKMSVMIEAMKTMKTMKTVETVKRMNPVNTAKTVNAAKTAKARRLIALGLAALCLLAAAGCGGSGQSGAKDTIIIYDGGFSEHWIMHRIIKGLVEEHTDAKVDIKEQMTGPLVFDSMVRGEADLSNSYDGSLLTTYLHLDVTDVPEGMSTYDFVNEQAMAEHGIILLDKLGFFNNYVLAVTQAVYERYGTETVSDLAEVSGELIFGAEHDFFSEEGSAKFGPLSAFYGLNFKESRSIDIGLKYSAMESGVLDSTVVYSTDGLNRKVGLKQLLDDKAYFPEYNGAIMVRAALFEEMRETAPNLKEVLNMLGGRFSNEIMTDLSYAVDVEGKTPDEVAENFLREQGLIG